MAFAPDEDGHTIRHEGTKTLSGEVAQQTRADCPPAFVLLALTAVPVAVYALFPYAISSDDIECTIARYRDLALLAAWDTSPCV
jgi:hypothetical protein